MPKADKGGPAGHYKVRVAVALERTLLAERFVRRSQKVTIGESGQATFTIPGRGRDKSGGVQTLVSGTTLTMLEGLSGRLHLGGQTLTVDQVRAQGHAAIKLAPEDWGVLYPTEHPSLRLVVQCVRDERLGRMRQETFRDPIIPIVAVCAVAFILFHFAALLAYEANKDSIELAKASDRMSRVMFNKPPEEEEEEEPVVSNKEQEEEKEAKRAGGDEGKFGRPDRKGPSNVPKVDDARARTADLAMVGALNDAKDSKVMQDLLGTSGAISNAVGGLDDGELLVGGGNYGMSTKGSGRGGGGEGEGVIGGTGNVDTGGAGSANRKKSVKGAGKPSEKTVSVKTGNATVKGQLSKALIDKEVRRHKAQVRFCYNKQLTRHPELAGKVVLSWIINMDGSVKKARVKTSSLNNKDAESCMVRALESWNFPRPQGGVVAVDYPFMFGAK